MANRLESHVLDYGLDALRSEATDIVVCSAEPADYAQANVDYVLGRKVFGSGSCFGALQDALPHGRKLASAAVVGGAVSKSGTASHWAVIDTVNARLLAVGQPAEPLALLGGGTFALPSFEIMCPAHGV